MLIINLIGLLLIGFIIWWFWLYKVKDIQLDTKQPRIIVENGVYQPSRIKLSAGQSTTLQFVRKDASPCAETLLIPALGMSETLPLNTVKSIMLPELKTGIYTFHCQMQMYRGELVVGELVVGELPVNGLIKDT